MSKCIFCKQEGALTREHVIPNWLCTIYPSQEMVINEFVGDNHKQWVSKVFQHKARIVCSTCNSGWMSELEQTSKPLITKMLNLETVVLNEKEQNTLSFWAQKTFLMLNQSIPNGLKITQDTFDDIYSKKSYSKKELVNLGWRMNFQGDKKIPWLGQE